MLHVILILRGPEISNTRNILRFENFVLTTSFTFFSLSLTLFSLLVESYFKQLFAFEIEKFFKSVIFKEAIKKKYPTWSQTAS